MHGDRQSRVKDDSAARVIHEKEDKGLRKLGEPSCKHKVTEDANIDSSN